LATVIIVVVVVLLPVDFLWPKRPINLNN